MANPSKNTEAKSAFGVSEKTLHILLFFIEGLAPKKVGNRTLARAIAVGMYPARCTDVLRMSCDGLGVLGALNRSPAPEIESGHFYVVSLCNPP